MTSHSNQCKLRAFVYHKARQCPHTLSSATLSSRADLAATTFVSFFTLPPGLESRLPALLAFPMLLLSSFSSRTEVNSGSPRPEVTASEAG